MSARPILARRHGYTLRQRRRYRVHYARYLIRIIWVLAARAELRCEFTQAGRLRYRANKVRLFIIAKGGQLP